MWVCLSFCLSCVCVNKLLFNNERFDKMIKLNKVRWLYHVFFGRLHTYFNVKISRFNKEIALFSGYIQPIFIKQSTSHIRIWALFINVHCIHILHAVFANILNKCNFRDKIVGSVHTYICFVYLQILLGGFEQPVHYVYEKCSYSHIRCTLLYENCWI